MMTGLAWLSRRARICEICKVLVSACKAVRAVLSWWRLPEVSKKELTLCLSMGSAFKAERTEARSASVIAPSYATMGVG